jgi:phage repressor protein C with HTH and peptisase S24 domain
MKNRIAERLNFLINSLKINIKEFSQRVGIPYTTMLDYCKGKSLPGAESLEKIATVFHVSLNWLLTGEGEPFIKKQEPTLVSEKPSEYNSGYVYIPVSEGHISAGAGLIPVTDIEIRLAFREDWVKRKGDPKKMVLIRVKGDSMEPTFYSGDIVLVDTNKNFVDIEGGIYAITIDNKIMVKRIQVLYNEGKLKIISDNPRYEPIIISPENIIINGKVIWFAREIEK